MEESNPEILTSNKSRQYQTVRLTLLIKMRFPDVRCVPLCLCYTLQDLFSKEQHNTVSPRYSRTKELCM